MTAKRYIVTVEEYELSDEVFISRAAEDVLMDDRLIMEAKTHYVDNWQNKKNSNERYLEIVCIQYLMDHYAEYKDIIIDVALSMIKEKIPKLWMKDIVSLQSRSFLNPLPFINIINEFIELIDGKVTSDVFRYRIDLYTDDDVVARMAQLSKEHFLHIMVETIHEDGTNDIIHYDNGDIYNHEIVQYPVRRRDEFTTIKGEK